MASNVEATKRGYEFFQRGDIPSLLRNLIADNCTWISPGPKEIVARGVLFADEAARIHCV